MLHQILLIEKEIVYMFTMLLILFNLVSLYFIVDLLSYDEIVGYLTNGEIKSGNTRDFALLFFGATASNLLFISVTLIDRFYSKDAIKTFEPK